MKNELLEWCRESENWWSPNPDREGWRYILFDTPDGKTQRIRIFTRVQGVGLTACQGRILNPWTGKSDPILHPDITIPIPDDLPGREGKEYYVPSPGYCFFGFYKLVPGIKPEWVIKKILSEIYQYTEKNPRHSGFWVFSYSPLMSILSGKGLIDLIWSLGCQDEINSLSDSYSCSIKFIDTNRESFLISRRHGVDFRRPGTLQIWRDTIMLLRKFGMDTRSPKYIATHLQETHDRLLAREDRRRAIDFREEDLKYREKMGKYLGWTKEMGDLKVVPVQSVIDCYQTGRKLHNCCYQAGYHTREDTLLLKVYVSGKLTELAEIGVRGHSIRQCLGDFNKMTSDHARIMDFLQRAIKDLP